MYSGASARQVAIVHVAESFGGGVASAIRDYARNAPEFEHRLIYAERAEAPIGPDETADFSGAMLMPHGHLARVSWIKDYIGKSGESVILHAHSSLAGAYVRLAVRASSTPIVYTPHCYSFERRTSSPAVKAVHRFAEWVFSFNTTVFAACSRREANLSQWLLSQATVVLVPNVAPIRGEGRKGLTEAASAPLLVAGAGRLSAQKDPKFFADTVSALRESGYSIRAQWIGGGDESMVEMLEGTGITVTGWQSRDAGLRLLAEADVYVHTAAWEGFPVALLESISLGVPVVARAIPALNGINLPLVMRKPEDAVAFWHRLGTKHQREIVLQACQRSVENNTDRSQATALSRAYSHGLKQLNLHQDRNEPYFTKF